MNVTVLNKDQVDVVVNRNGSVELEDQMILHPNNSWSGVIDENEYSRLKNLAKIKILVH